jgi:hypothetical protein
MHNLSQIVGDLLERNGMEPRFDPLRLEWSKWFRCESSFSVLLAPCRPGIFALGEEVVSATEGSKRMLALFHVAETDDVGMTLGRLFLPGNPLRERLFAGRCFARYAVIEDAAQRTAACAIFQRWMQQSTEVATGIGTSDVGTVAVRTNAAGVHESAPGPSISFALRMESQNRDKLETVGHPAPLPSGF